MFILTNHKGQEVVDFIFTMGQQIMFSNYLVGGDLKVLLGLVG